METSSKNFRPFVYVILALGVIVAISVAVIYGQLFEEIEHEPTETLTPAQQEKIEEGPAGPTATANDTAQTDSPAQSPAETNKPHSDCEGKFRRCMNGTDDIENNPYAETSCNVAKTIGGLDPSTWEKCRNWCQEQRQDCEKSSQ